MEVSHGKQLALRFTGGAKRGLSGRPGGIAGNRRTGPCSSHQLQTGGIIFFSAIFILHHCFLFHSLRVSMRFSLCASGVVSGGGQVRN